MLYYIGRFILWLGRWKIVNFPPDIPKMIIIGGPHTSNWDFLYAISLRYVARLELRYFIKQEWMDTPLGWLFKAMGGYGVDRTTNNNWVDIAVSVFNKEEEFVLALSPEGTRSKIKKLRSGFYHIAHTAQVPLVLLALDYGKREFRFSEPFYTSDDKEGDLAHITQWFGQSRGKHPELGIGYTPTSPTGAPKDK